MIVGSAPAKEAPAAAPEGAGPIETDLTRGMDDVDFNNQVVSHGKT